MGKRTLRDSAVFAAFTFFILAVLGPLHHHEDGKTHPDCVACHSAAQNAVKAPEPVMPSPVLAVFHHLSVIQASVSFFLPFLLFIRAPPDIVL
jgi:hypothetical protein